MSTFVGRDEPMSRLIACYDACRPATVGLAPSWPHLALVTGQAGIGKTALLTRFAQVVAASGATVLWGTCWDDEQAPSWWPWTQALRALLRSHPDLAHVLAPQVRAVIQEGSPVDVVAAHDATGRTRLLVAVKELLSEAAARTPLVIVLDDLQWSDPSSRELLRFLVRQPGGAFLLACAYRPDELSRDAASELAVLASAAEQLPLQPLDGDEVTALVEAMSGAEAARRWGRLIYSRSGGHPFFARELCHLSAAGDPAVDVPSAVREVILRRLQRLSPECGRLLDVAAVAGTRIRPTLLAELTGDDLSTVNSLLTEAAAAGVLHVRPESMRPRFAHDLYRETIIDGVPPEERRRLHARIGHVMAQRHQGGSRLFASEVARHFAASARESGADPVLQWARAAAAADVQRYAFGEAAGHLDRARDALARDEVNLQAPEQVTLLAEEGDLWLRDGSTDRARARFDEAWGIARTTGRAELIGVAALGFEACGARFAMPRAELVAVLDSARASLAGTDTRLEAEVTAALARQLQHSVVVDRPRATPLAQEAVRLARALGHPTTLAGSLLALHDVLWRPGTADDRLEIAQEMAELARQAGDEERLSQALLLVTTAQLERGNPAFRATHAEFAHLTAALRQPRHDYVVATRRAAMTLLDGNLEYAEKLSIEAERLGYGIGDPDAGNVRMTQRLEIARARHDPEELMELAAAAVAWWTGLPTHAHAVAAGFLARAGNLEGARQELDTLLALDWRSDRSYMWALYIGQVATAAIALDDHAVCGQVLSELEPLVDTCAVGGALVSFMGCHAYTVGLLHGSLGAFDEARLTLERALAIHRRIGARLWVEETAAALSELGQQVDRLTADVRPRLVLVGGLWEVHYRDRAAHLPDLKGIRDLATLISRPGELISALDLAGAGVTEQAPRQPVLDRVALSAYRRRLAQLEEELEEARDRNDLARLSAAQDEREALVQELRRATRPGGTAVNLGPTAAERARKAVSARIWDAIGRIDTVLPDLGTHLRRCVHTGTSCRYAPQ